MNVPTGDDRGFISCTRCRTEVTHSTHHRVSGIPFALQHHRLVPCGPEHNALWEKAKKSTCATSDTSS